MPNTIKNLVNTKLDALAAQDGSGPFVLSVAGALGTLHAQLRVVDQLACSFDQMEYQSDRLADADMEQMKAVSDDLVSRMTYLLEPLGVLELDEESASIQLRSVPPSKEDGTIRYYELVVQRGGSIKLERYERPKDSHDRVTIPAEVTRDVFQRLASDMEASLD